MKKLHKVHMLPTKNESHIRNWYPAAKSKIHNKIRYYKNATKNNNGTNYHLYFTSDEQPKEGDWFITLQNNIFKCSRVTNTTVYFYQNDDGYEYCSQIERCKKIVATTDKSLTDGEWDLGIPKHLLQIPQSFIEEYIKAGGIDEVCLEMERIQDKIVFDGKSEFINPFKIKLNENNCVIIHPVEPKLYTREELIHLLEVSNHLSYLSGVKIGKGNKSSFDIDNWIKENLK